ncbi:hypothetical protein LJ737_25130 [Hymenobacter sp. 15J16-1T3B]|uniref:hypothetical protein n=1 Tax=Hymenobacter sp. 15J16-1T3B TaxID=2886941 RepID=UPI001D12D82D|nr:hypothetical protein [Hymenobacter sp. 15J16-1T3B]MCC3160545.1 hypothetical protein [Hymenobacter sp. 15J16-1T3B]
MNRPYRIVIGSPVDYEELVAYIVINGVYVALLDQDQGELNVTLLSEVKGLPFDVLVEALQEAKRQLLQ